MYRSLCRVLLLVLAISLASIHVFPQAGVSSAELKGKVLDQTNAVLPGASVTITNVATSASRSLITDDRGEYRASLLPPGTYDVKTEMAGFATKIIKGINLTVGQSATMDIKVELAQVATEVVVTGAAPLIEAEKTQQADVIDEKRIQNLPINGRNYLDYAFLTPGVTDANALIVFTLPQTPTSGLAFTGQSGRSNNVSVDGADNNDYAVGSVRSTMSQEAVQEFQINRSNFTAEFGKAAGGLINIISKSGSNEFHGNVFAYLRNKKIQAREYFSFSRDAQGNLVGTKQPFTRVQPGFTLGGPIVKDKTFFFGSYEALTQHESRIVSFGLSPRLLQPSPAQEQIIRVLEGSSLQADRTNGANLRRLLTMTRERNPFLFSKALGLEIPNTAFPFKGISNTASIRVDHKLGAKDTLFARYNFTNSNSQGLSFGGLKAPSRGSNLKVQDHSFVVSNIHIFNPRNINEFRFQYSDRYFNSTPSDPFGPAIDIFGVAFIGRDFFIPSERKERRFQWADNFSFTRGKHEFKTGLDISHLLFDTDTRVFFGGRFTFTGITIPLSAVGLVGGTPAGTPDGSALFSEILRAIAALNRLGRRDLADGLALFGGNPVTFTTLQSINYNLPASYQQGFGDPIVSLDTQQLAFYFQDGIKVTSNFYLNLGIRYDLELQDTTPGRFLPRGINRDKNNFGPRVGFSWDPFRDGKTTIRGGYGIYYAPLFQAIGFVGRVLDGSQILQRIIPFSTILPGARRGDSGVIFGHMRNNGFLFGRTLTQDDLSQLLTSCVTIQGRRVCTDRSTIVPPAIFTVPTNIVNPYSHQASLGIEREVVKDLSVSVNYIINRGVKLLRGRNGNLRLKTPFPDCPDRNLWLSGAPDTTFIPGTRIQRCPNPPLFDRTYGVIPQQTNKDLETAQLNYAETSGSSIYHGMALTANKRFSRHYQFLVSYTWSKAIDDTTDFISDLQPNDQLDLRSERSLSSFDQRHRLVLSGVLESPFKAGSGQPFYSRVLADMILAPIVTIGSARPFNLLFGDDILGDRNFNTHRPISLRADGRPNLGPDGGPIFAGRNTGIGPDFVTVDLRLAKKMKIDPEGKTNIEMIFEGFNMFNRANFSGVNVFTGTQFLPDFRVQGSKNIAPTDPLGFTSTFSPRQFQVALKLNF